MESLCPTCIVSERSVCPGNSELIIQSKSECNNGKSKTEIKSKTEEAFCLSTSLASQNILHSISFAFFCLFSLFSLQSCQGWNARAHVNISIN